MKIKYIGQSASFTDNLYGSRMFFPVGEFVDAPESVAKKLLRHPEFAEFTGEPAEQAPGAPNILDMSKAEFGEYAKKLGIDLDMRKSLENLRKDLAEALNEVIAEGGED